MNLGLLIAGGVGLVAGYYVVKHKLATGSFV